MMVGVPTEAAYVLVIPKLDLSAAVVDLRDVVTSACDFEENEDVEIPVDLMEIVTDVVAKRREE